MFIKLWGVRGSLPAPHSVSEIEGRVRAALESFFDSGNRSREQIEGFLSQLPAHRFGGYGGNTPCLEVQAGGARVLVDAGSGLRQLGYELMNGPCGAGQGEVHLLFTHFHWDHVMGLPFFTPLFIPGNKIHVYSVQPELEDVFKVVFKKPFFPVPLDKLGAKIEYHRLPARKAVRFGEMKVTPYQLDHPDPCWGFRFEHGGRAFSHCVDTECVRVTREEMGEDIALYQNVDLMTFDAQYTLMEKLEKVNWGHAASFIGLDIALREQVRKIVFMHHDPAATDEKVATVEAQTRRYFESRIKSLRGVGDGNAGGRMPQWLFAREGMSLEV